MRWLAVVLALAACDADTAPAPWLDCVEAVCERLPACSPILPSRWAGWDWRTRESCLHTMTCGDRLDECRAAVEALPCIGPGATPWLDAAHTRGVREIKRACRVAFRGDMGGEPWAAGWDKGAR